ncbi:methylmalonyl-CoA epimerase [Amycolatopsis sp. CB00013]|uniref:methylmalonyl-CoA epimerase n=1 Tax=Amycolatopsis sp. CB00013 TaxID=1703945 RepID=UPI00093BBA5B|nr:methylmalonyl-CoA epimerase [Amycolatopsis sp. CB00013]OKJ92068.1 glyoxalase [Amycolatopsis sp. CB00013]
MNQALKPFVTAIDHVGIAVPDLDAAIAFHAEHFGLEVAHEEINEEQGVREAMLRAPGTAGTETAIQLLAPLRDDSAIGKFLAKSGPGLQQLAYRVSDVDAAAESLRAQGLRLLYAEAKRGTSNSRVNFVHPKDAGGVLVELVEPAKDGH